LACICRIRSAGRSVAATACAVVAAFVTEAALAQVPLPPSIDPGRVDERATPPRKPAPRPPTPETGTPTPVLPDSLKAVRVRLKEVSIEGSSKLVDQAWALANRYVGREITAAEILELGRELTALYRNAGYILSQVIVPSQTLSDGRLALRVVEGYIANVRVEGDTAVAGKLAALGEKIKASRPLKAGDLERYLLIANDLPGVRVRAVLSPSQAGVGAADLTLVATVKKVEGFLSIDNYGSKYLGPWQIGIGAGTNQVFGANDQLRFVGVTTGNSELAYGQLSYNQIVNAEGLKLGASVSQARTRPGDALQSAEIRGEADTVSFMAAYPLLRTRNDSLLARAAYDLRNITTDIGGARFNEDRLRVVRLGMTWTSFDRFDANNVLDVDFSNGVDAAKQDEFLKSRAGADNQFRKLTFDYERFQRLGASFGVTLGAGGQWTNEALFSSEQFALGGRRFGRAYEPAELVGDRGLAFRVEPAYLGRTGSEWLGAYHLFTFYDAGKVWYNDPGPVNRPAQSLASAGFGARVFSTDRISATLELAKPLTRDIASYQADNKGRRARILGSVVVRF
jgi:hemolysin activation/secretion protein